MEPILAALPSADQIVLIPIGLLALLPLHAASASDITASTGRRYALDACVITYAPSCRALTSCRRLAAETPVNNLLAIGDPSIPGMPSLYHARQEAEMAMAGFSRGILLTGDSATRTAVTWALANADVLHFAGLGFGDSQTPLDSGLMLTQGDIITLRDLMQLRLRARLAVLSGTFGSVSIGESMTASDSGFTLASGLIKAGVAGVISSLLPTEDRATSLLMWKFYELWRKVGMTPAGALNGSQLWLRDTTSGQKIAELEAALNDSGTMPILSRVVEDHLEWLLLGPPEDYAFSDPTSWAGFTYHGA